MRADKSSQSREQKRCKFNSAQWKAHGRNHFKTRRGFFGSTVAGGITRRSSSDHAVLSERPGNRKTAPFTPAAFLLLPQRGHPQVSAPFLLEWDKGQFWGSNPVPCIYYRSQNSDLWSTGRQLWHLVFLPTLVTCPSVYWPVQAAVRAALPQSSLETPKVDLLSS